MSRFGPVEYYTDNTTSHIRNGSALSPSGNDWFNKYMIGIGGPCSVYDPPVRCENVLCVERTYD